MKKSIKTMTICLIGILIFWSIVIYQNHKFNSTTHILQFNENLSDQVQDENVSVQILPRDYGTSSMSSWYYSMVGAGNYNGSYVGTIYELTLTNLSEEVIADWGFELTFPCDTMFAEGWNGDFDMHQYVDEDEREYVFAKSKFVTDGLTLEYLKDQAVLLMPFHKGDYFVYTPSEDSLEVPLGGSDAKNNDFSRKVIGFIVYTKGVPLEYNMKFCEGLLHYNLQRSLLKEPLFYVVFLLSWSWLVALIVIVVVRFKMLKLQKEKQAMEAMVHKFEQDDSTDVLSRRAFLHYGQALIDSSEQTLGVAIVDIDNYVVMQHKLGEAICAEYVQYLANYLKKRFADGVVGRYSRGRLAIVFPVDDVNAINPKLFVGEAVKEQSPMPDQKLKVGIYAPIDPQFTIERCCDRTMLALEKIKDEYEQNVSYFDETMETHILDKHTITAHMEEALNRQQFKVYYQPKNDSVTKAVVGAEALVRWIHPEYGFMNPGQFIPVFEEQGFITKVDAYVFEQVCRDLKKWKEEGRKLFPVSVNISRKDFYEKGWIEQRIAYAKSLEIAPSLIHIEITESLYSEDTELIQSKVKQLRDLGYLVELDDFGSGYSSLGLLGRLSIDIIKLDISFVRNMDISGVVLESVVDMAHKLKLKTIAEGVETEAQYEVIKKIGCDMIQGYYFSKPLERDAFEAYIQK